MRCKLVAAAFAASVALSSGTALAADLEVVHWWT